MIRWRSKIRWEVSCKMGNAFICGFFLFFFVDSLEAEALDYIRFEFVYLVVG